MKAGSYTLYGVEGSYYAAKIRSYLLHKRIPFEELPCDRAAFEDVIVPRVGYPIIPVVITPQNETLQDTADIIDILEQRHPQPSMIPSTPVRRFAAYLMEFYADEWLKLPALHYRWYYDYEFAHRMMGCNNDPNASEEEQRRVGAKIAARFKSWPQHLGVSDTTRDAVEASFLECLALLQSHFEIHRFAFGDVPCIADCALMGPLYAHLFHDPYSGRIVRRNAPAVCEWINRMRRPEALDGPSANVADEIPETMISVFQHLSADYVPVLTTAMPLLQAWLGNGHVAEIPRYAGKHRYVMGQGKPYESHGFRSIHPFEQWKLQRVLAIIETQTPAGRERIRQFCDSIGATDLLSLEFPNRLQRRYFRLVRAG